MGEIRHAAPLDGARRILLYGGTGSGKSTLAQRLSRATGIEWVDVDARTWRPGWESVSEEEQRAFFSDVVARDEWILDTAYSTWRDVVLARAEVVVALDFPRWMSLLRLVRRTVRRVWTREVVCNGNVETLRKALASDSIIAWHFRSFARKRRWIAQQIAQQIAQHIAQQIATVDGPLVVRLGHPREVEVLVTALERASLQ
jgi:adenylate kinase family enzyme